VPACDRQTDGQTDVQPISITCFSIAGARKNETALSEWFMYFYRLVTSQLMETVTERPRTFSTEMHSSSRYRPTIPMRRTRILMSLNFYIHPKDVFIKIVFVQKVCPIPRKLIYLLKYKYESYLSTGLVGLGWIRSRQVGSYRKK